MTESSVKRPLNVDEDGIAQLSQMIFNLGNPHPSMSVAEDIEQTAKFFLENRSESQKISQVIAVCALEQPHKSSHFTSLIESIHAADPNLSSQIITSIASIAGFYQNSESDNSEISQNDNHLFEWRHSQRALILLANLTRSLVLSTDSFKIIINSILSFVQLNRSAPPSDRSDPMAAFLCWALYSSLHYLSQELANDLKIRLDSLLDQFDIPDLTQIASISLSNSYAQPIIDDSRSVRVDLSINPKNQYGIGWNGNFQTKMLVEWDAPIFVADATDFERWEAVLLIRHLVESFEMNHRKCAATLLSLNIPSIASVERLIVDFMFSAIMKTCQSPRLLPIYFETLAMDCCRLASRSFPPIFARGLNFLLRDNVFSLLEIHRLASYFALHLSNFELRWNWNAWVSWIRSSSIKSTETPQECNKILGQALFIRLTVDHMLRLSFLDRVKPSIIPEMHFILDGVNTDATDHLKSKVQYVSDVKSFSLSEKLVESLIQSLRHRDDSETILSLLHDSSTSNDSDQYISDPSSKALPASSSNSISHSASASLLQAVLTVGQTSPSHWMSVIELNLGLLSRCLNLSRLDSSSPLDQIFTFYAHRPAAFEVAIERLINYRLMSASHLLSWVLYRAEALLFSASLHSSSENVHSMDQDMAFENQATDKNIGSNEIHSPQQIENKDEDLANITNDDDAASNSNQASRNLNEPIERCLFVCNRLLTPLLILKSLDQAQSLPKIALQRMQDNSTNGIIDDALAARIERTVTGLQAEYEASLAILHSGLKSLSEKLRSENTHENAPLAYCMAHWCDRMWTDVSRVNQHREFCDRLLSPA